MKDKKVVDTNVVRLNNLKGSTGVNSSKVLQTRAEHINNNKNKIDTAISDASTNAISQDKIKDKDISSGNNSPKKKFMFKTISKIYFADHREVSDLLEPNLM